MTATATYRPHWLRQRILANARKAKLDICPCGTPVLAGLDDDACAWPAVVDTSPLIPAGELAAVYLEDRRTYDLCVGELWRRERTQHGRESRAPVLPEHRCNDPVPSAWTKPPDPNRRKDLPDDPPF